MQSALHAPALDRSGFDKAKHNVLDCKTNQNDREQASEHFRNVELVLALEYVPAEPALTRRYAEYQFGRDQRPPGEGPADLEAGQNAGKRRGDENARDEAQASQIVVAPNHSRC